MDGNSRLLKELREIESDKKSGVSVELVDGKLTHMTGTIKGAARSAAAAHTCAWPPWCGAARPGAARRQQTGLADMTRRMAGPEGTAYEGGTFRIDVRLPSDYPFEPPKCERTRRAACGTRSAPLRPPAMLMLLCTLADTR